MSYRFRRRETVADGVRRMAREQVDRVLAAIEDDRLGSHETVHQVRQRCKKIRGLLRIVRPQFEDTYRKENARFRKAATRLSHLRDAQSMVDCFNRLMQQHRDRSDRRRFSFVSKRLKQRRDELAHQQGDVEKRLRKFRKKMRAAKSRIDDWSIPADEFEALAGGFEKTYSRARDAMYGAFAHPSTENFHNWRKHVKYHGYHCRLLRGIWPGVLDAYRETLDQLGELLGDDHDLANVRTWLVDASARLGKPREIEGVLRLIDCRRSHLQEAARPLGLRLLIHDPAEITNWFSNCWTVWRNGHEPPDTLVIRTLAPPVRR